MTGVRIKGLGKLQRQLKKNVTMNDVKCVVRQNGAELQEKIQRNAEFTQGYQTGDTKRSISLELTDGGMTAESGPSTEYSEYLELGTRFMEAQPFVEPALREQAEQFEKDLKKLTK